VVDGLVVVDTDLVIDYLRRAEPGASLVRRLLRSQSLRITAVTAFELRLGADFFQRAEAIGALLATATLPLDLMGALQAGEIFEGLAKTGRGIGMRDALIAGICLRFGLPLATRNRRHFERVEGLDFVSGWPPDGSRDSAS